MTHQRHAREGSASAHLQTEWPSWALWIWLFPTSPLSPAPGSTARPPRLTRGSKGPAKRGSGDLRGPSEIRALRGVRRDARTGTQQPALSARRRRTTRCLFLRGRLAGGLQRLSGQRSGPATPAPCCRLPCVALPPLWPRGPLSTPLGLSCHSWATGVTGQGRWCCLPSRPGVVPPRDLGARRKQSSGQSLRDWPRGWVPFRPLVPFPLGLGAVTRPCRMSL